MATPSPLNKANLQSINATMKKVLDYHDAISKAERVGLDVTAHRQQADYYNNMLTEMKKVFFPGQP